MRATEAGPKLQRRQVVAWLGAGLAWPARAQTKADAANLGKPWRLPAGARLELQAGADGLDLPATLRAVQEWTIPASSQLVVRLADGEHAMRQAITWRHPDGARLSVLGNAADPSRCRLLWTAASDGFYVGAGQVLGGLDGVSLLQTAGSGTGSGLLADEGGVLQCGPNVRIDGFYYGVQARRNGAARCEGVQVSGGGDANFFAFMGGHLHARHAVSIGARDDALRLGSGFVAEYGGSIDAEGAVARLNALDGFTALSNGAIRAYRSRAERNGRSGYFTDTGGRIVGHDAVAEANCGEGLLARDGARAITGERIEQRANHAEPATCRAR